MVHTTYDKRIGKEVKKAIRKRLNTGFPATNRYNSDYKPSELLDVAIFSIARDYFVEEGSETLKRIRKKVADADTVFYRIKPATTTQVLTYFETTNQRVLTTAKNLGVFNKPCKCAIDWHDKMVYTKKLRQAVRTKSKNGTDYALRYASIESVESNLRFTFHAIPCTPFTDMCDVVHKLILKTQEYVPNISLLLMDRGFFNARVIDLLNNLNIPFVIPAVKNRKIAALIRTARRTRSTIPNTSDSFYLVDYLLAEQAKTQLVFYFRPSKDPTELDECFVFSTNLSINIGNIKKVAEDYRTRWGIETGYRIKERVVGKTCSRSYVVRLLLLLLSVLLYNLWTLLKILRPDWVSVYKRFTLNKLKDWLRRSIEVVE